MLFKRLAVLILSISLLLCVGCKEKVTVKEKENEELLITEKEDETEKNPYSINPLTGVQDLDPAFEATRPVAVMINNISVAQSVQCGLDMADIVYETEVEGGITRLMAVYQDVSKVAQLGTVRSSRYAYIDLARGHNALYIHHGQDPIYAEPYLKQTDHVTLDVGTGGEWIKNGKAKEHTLYAKGTELWEYLSKNRTTENKKAGYMWVPFTETQVTFENTANTVTVPFSNYSVSTFTYDAASGKYTRLAKNTVLKDYVTGQATTVKNVFVLMTSITNYPDNYHRKIDLNSGTGYYFTNGTYTQINWQKGNADSGFKFTDANGEMIKVSEGDSWVCLANKTNCNITIQ